MRGSTGMPISRPTTLVPARNDSAVAALGMSRSRASVSMWVTAPTCDSMSSPKASVEPAKTTRPGNKRPRPPVRVGVFGLLFCLDDGRGLRNHRFGRRHHEDDQRRQQPERDRRHHQAGVRQADGGDE